MLTAEKQVAENRLLGFNFASEVAPGVTVSFVSATITPYNKVAQVTALTAGSNLVVGQMIKMFVIGGTSGELYLVQVRALCSDGQTLICSGLVYVVDESTDC